MKVNINAKSINQNIIADTVNINQTLPNLHSNPPDTKLSESNLKEIITTHERRLQKLKEQQAKQGLSTDPSVIIEIEDIEANLENLYIQLEQWKEH